MPATRRALVGTAVFLAVLAMVIGASGGCGNSKPKGHANNDANTDRTADANRDANSDANGSDDKVGLAEVAIGSDAAEVSASPDATAADTGAPDAPGDATLDASDASDTSDASTLADGADGDTSPGTPNLVYTARGTAGGIDRLYLKVNDTARGVCLQVLMHSPPPATPLASATGLSVPNHFGVARVSLHSGTVCGNAIIGEAGTAATEATGQITWQPNGILVFPSALDVHATLTFPAAPPLVYHLSATNVPVP